MGEWEASDFMAYEALTEDHPKLFQECLRAGHVICVPADCSVMRWRKANGGRAISEDYLRWHCLVRSKKFKNQFSSLMSPDATVVLQGPQEEFLRMGGKWPWAPIMAQVIKKEVIARGASSPNGAGAEPAAIYLLDRAFSSGDGKQAAGEGSMAFFGRRGQTIQDAIEYLMGIDPSAVLLSAVSSEAGKFRSQYKAVSGYEQAFFDKVIHSCEQLEEQGINHATTAAVSMSRQGRCTRLAIETYLHSQVYQQTFPMVVKLAAPDDRKLAANIAAMKEKGVRPSELGLDTSVFNSVDFSPVGASIALVDIGTSPFDKLQYINKISDAITNSIPEHLRHELSADAMLPLLGFLLVQHACPNMAAHVRYLSTFTSAVLEEDSELEYAFVTFSAAVDHLTNCGAAEGKAVASLPSPGVGAKKPPAGKNSASTTSNNSNGGGSGVGLSMMDKPAADDDDFDEDEYERQKQRAAARRARSRK